MQATHRTPIQRTGAAGEWLQHEIEAILNKLHRSERLTRADLATGALALSMVRRYNRLLPQERHAAIQHLLADINTVLAAHPEFLPFEGY